VITLEMIVVKHIFSIMEMSNWTRVYLNNLLSLPFQPIFFLITKEDRKIASLDFSPPAIIFLTLSCFIGLALAWSGTALRSRISATSFTVVGVTCKIMTEFVNFLIWDKHANEIGLLSLGICLVGSTIFVPSPERNETTTISNAAWNGLNRLTGGCFQRFELESPHFSRKAETQQYTAVPTVEENEKSPETMMDDLKADKKDHA
jgi:hypothetical protein